MTFYLHPYPYARPYRRVAHRGIESRKPALGINVREEDEAYILSALVPGLKSEDLNIQVLDDVVRIEGEYMRSGPVDKADENEYLLRELPNGPFTRTLQLPAAIETESVEANIADGVLTLRLPKAESARPKKIQVKLK
jgi:HSP20 family protein